MNQRPALCFGPVPSRRLGQSLGVNTIPPKTCSYACVYCQLGRTPRMQVRRQVFSRPDVIVDAVRSRLEECRRDRVKVDYLAVVPDGEPTLDLNLGRLLTALREFGPPVAVITNGSLLDRKEVREELALADWVSVKVDAVREAAWHDVDRPYGKLRLERELEGLLDFADAFTGTLATETMLVADVNDGEEDIEALAAFLECLRPDVAYLAIPTRPPAEWWVRPPKTADIVRTHEALCRRLPRVELMIGDPEEEVAPSTDVERDLLAITAVHPLDEAGVVELGGGDDGAVEVARTLVARGRLEEAVFDGRRFFVRAGRKLGYEKA